MERGWGCEEFCSPSWIDGTTKGCYEEPQSGKGTPRRASREDLWLDWELTQNGISAGGGGGRSGGKALLLSFSLPPRPWAIVDSSRPSSGRMQPSRLALLSGGAGQGRGKGWGRLQQFI